jgi:hypothetical protein
MACILILGLVGMAVALDPNDPRLQDAQVRWDAYDDLPAYDDVVGPYEEHAIFDFSPGTWQIYIVVETIIHPILGQIEVSYDVLEAMDPETNAVIQVTRGSIFNPVPFEVVNIGVPGYEYVLSPFPNPADTSRFQVKLVDPGDLATIEVGGTPLDAGLTRMTWGMGDSVGSDEDAYFANARTEYEVANALGGTEFGGTINDYEETIPGYFESSARWVQRETPLSSVSIRAGAAETGFEYFNSVYVDNIICTFAPVNGDGTVGNASDAPATDFGGDESDETNEDSGELDEDTEAPEITAISADPTTIWPPNKEMKKVTVSVTATDNVAPNPTCVITSVTCNEDIDGDDYEIDGLCVWLRADRDGTGDGRVYTITVTCSDWFDNASTETVTVTVPHDEGD